jgi:hypothetical protein
VADPNVADIATGAGGGVGLAGVVWLLATRLFKRDDRVEAEVSTKLDHLTADVASMRSDMRLLVQELGAHRGEVAEVKARVEGLSKAYGPALDALKERLIRLETRLEGK